MAETKCSFRLKMGLTKPTHFYLPPSRKRRSNSLWPISLNLHPNLSPLDCRTWKKRRTRRRWLWAKACWGKKAFFPQAMNNSQTIQCRSFCWAFPEQSWLCGGVVDKGKAGQVISIYSQTEANPKVLFSFMREKQKVNPKWELITREKA